MDTSNHTPRCLSCGGTEFEDGFIETLGQNGVRWMSGPMKTNFFGGAKKSNSQKHPVLARACVSCGYLALYRGAATN